MMNGKILLVDDEEHIRLACEQAFELADVEIEVFSSAEMVLHQISKSLNGIVISDIRMPDINGMDLMKKIHAIDIEMPVVLITGHADVALAVEAMKNGAYDFIEKPFASSRLVEVGKRALEKRTLILENNELRTKIGRSDSLENRLLGKSEKIVEIRRQISTLAPTDADVLIVGETGTGKDVAARAIHDLSERSGHPFVALNCAAIPVELIERELFGHEIGAFEGAIRSRYGKFEHARGGSVFLDGIEDMPLAMQMKLLRVLQERSITRLGANEAIPLDVRFIASSKADLVGAVEQGKFRNDLFYRLNAVTLRMPDLAERLDDVARLFQHFVIEAATRYRRRTPKISEAIFESLIESPWPGNVRELKNSADRFVLLGTTIDTEKSNAEIDKALPVQMAQYEKKIIARMLVENKGSLKSTYEKLGISRKSLYEKMQKHNLKR